jgi:hypothetical protein
MTLREKFKEKILSFLGDSMKEQNANQCEQIADDYAIEFAKWLEENNGAATYKQLLEIFKTEKGL